MTNRLTMHAVASYRIRVQGTLDQSWLQWLGPSFVVETDAGDPFRVVTTLTAQLCDQAALLGLLNSLYDANFPLLSVQRLKTACETEA